MRSSKHSLTGVYIYHLNREGKVINYLIALLEQLSRYIGINYAEVVSSVLTYFSVSKERLGYFITNNATNNGICLDYLSLKFSFKKETY